MTTKEMIAVMQAYVDGKEIQVQVATEGEWINTSCPCWDWFKFDYRIKPEDEPKRMTNRQLAEWLSRGFGSWKMRTSPTVCIDISYPTFEENTPVPNDIFISPWGSDEWVEPTVDIYNRDCKGE